MNFSEEHLQKEIRSIIAEALELEEDRIGMEDHFINDLGIDSITALDIVAGIEKRFNIKFPNEQLTKITSLKKAIEVASDYL